jgi:hypothetical protein
MVLYLSFGITLLYAVYVFNLYDIFKLTNFSDDNFGIRWNKHMLELIKDLEKDHEWLQDSGHKVNESMTEKCLSP